MTGQGRSRIHSSHQFLLTDDGLLLQADVEDVGRVRAMGNLSMGLLGEREADNNEAGADTHKKLTDTWFTNT